MALLLVLVFCAGINKHMCIGVGVYTDIGICVGISVGVDFACGTDVGMGVGIYALY